MARFREIGKKLSTHKGEGGGRGVCAASLCKESSSTRPPFERAVSLNPAFEPCVCGDRGGGSDDDRDGDARGGGGKEKAGGGGALEGDPCGDGDGEDARRGGVGGGGDEEKEDADECLESPMSSSQRQRDAADEWREPPTSSSQRPDDGCRAESPGELRERERVARREMSHSFPFTHRERERERESRWFRKHSRAFRVSAAFPPRGKDGTVSPR